MLGLAGVAVQGKVNLFVLFVIALVNGAAWEAADERRVLTTFCVRFLRKSRSGAEQGRR
jgi:hypothetical protein